MSKGGYATVPAGLLAAALFVLHAQAQPHPDTGGADASGGSQDNLGGSEGEAAPVAIEKVPAVPAGKAAAETAPKKTAARLTLYYDNRGYSTINLMTSADDLPLGLTFWGFTDLHGAQKSWNAPEITRYFMEYRVSREIAHGFGVQAEYNDLTGPGNRVVRFGGTFKHKLPVSRSMPGWIQWKLFPVETDRRGGQASVVYSIPLSKRLSVSGFADLNWKRRGWVLEPQLNFKCNDRYRLVLEFRRNDFEIGALRPSGIALGVERVF